MTASIFGPEQIKTIISKYQRVEMNPRCFINELDFSNIYRKNDRVEIIKDDSDFVVIRRYIDCDDGVYLLLLQIDICKFNGINDTIFTTFIYDDDYEKIVGVEFVDYNYGNFKKLSSYSFEYNDDRNSITIHIREKDSKYDCLTIEGIFDEKYENLLNIKYSGGCDNPHYNKTEDDYVIL